MLFPFNVESTQTVKNACTYTQTLSLTTSDEYEIVEISMNEMTLSKLYSNHCNINNHAQADPWYTRKQVRNARAAAPLYTLCVVLRVKKNIYLFNHISINMPLSV